MFARIAVAAAVVAGAAAPGRAEVKTRPVDYTYAGTTLKGVMAYDDARSGKRPGVLVVHEFWGLNDYAKDRAKQLAALGYVAFACDMYGNGKVTEHPNEAIGFVGELRENEAVWLGRAQAALKVLADDPRVDPTKLAAIGYCFGGSTAQKLLFAGADLDAVVSFHGSPVVPTPEQAKAAKGRLLMCNGADDTFIKKETIDQFEAKCKAGGVKLEFVNYPGTVHSFTVPDAGKPGDPPGMKYNEAADKDSWSKMKALFAEVFADGK